MTDLAKLGYKSMIREHLMNGQLGGPGIEANLFPITSQANSLHKMYVENVVKNYVSKISTPADRKKWGVFYCVEVTEAEYSSLKPNAKFTCEAYPWDKINGQIIEKTPIFPSLDIASYPTKGSTGTGTVEEIAVGRNIFDSKFKNVQKPFGVTASTPIGWRSQGSGKGRRGRNWTYFTPF